jgi:predicted RNA-binding Zn-ribbon protein involved in translation (DUF1610 family)
MDDEARITQALRRRGTSMLCPACNFVLRGPIGTYRLVAEEDGAASKGIKVSVYGCSNCGYVRLHSANVIGRLE